MKSLQSRTPAKKRVNQKQQSKASRNQSCNSLFWASGSHPAHPLTLECKSVNRSLLLNPTTATALEVLGAMPNSPVKRKSQTTRLLLSSSSGTQLKISFSSFIKIAKIWKSYQSFYGNHSDPWQNHHCTDPSLSVPNNIQDSSYTPWKRKWPLQGWTQRRCKISTHHHRGSGWFCSSVRRVMSWGGRSNPRGKTGQRTRWFFPQEMCAAGKSTHHHASTKKATAIQPNGKRKFHSSSDYDS